MAMKFRHDARADSKPGFPKGSDTAVFGTRAKSSALDGTQRASVQV